VRNSSRRLINAVLTAAVQSGSLRTFGSSRDIYTVLPSDLKATDEEVGRCELEWRKAGAVRVTGPQVDQSLEKARELQSEFNGAKNRSRPSFTLRYLYLVRLFVLTGLPRRGKAVLFGYAAALVCALSLAISPFFFSSLSVAYEGAFVLTLLGAGLAAGAIFILWPNDHKRQTFQRLQGQLKECKERVVTLRPALAQAWVAYKALHQLWALCSRLDKAHQKREKLAHLLASAKYQLIHTNWRAMRGVDFEHFLAQAFQMLGYQVQTTKASGDQGADLLVTGKGLKLAVQAKGYEKSVGNHSVMEVVAGMHFYQCVSCVVITNSYFTSTAEKLAQANGCRLIDEAHIPDLIEGHIY
jgi:Restriction endonuclease